MAFRSEESPMPKTLFDSTLDFVSEHVENIECLKGFPDIVGKKIFDKFVSYNDLALTPSDKQVKVISIFAEAYDELILESVVLSEGLIVINEYFDSFVVLFQFITELCLCLCYLGDGHELFEHMQNFSLLKKLCLQKNYLKDEAIRKITLPIRMFNKGPKNIEYLDLSDNTFTSSIVPWLSAFQQLQCLDLSGSNLSPESLHDLERKCSLKLCDSESNIHPIVTKGWATAMIEVWREIIIKRRKNIKKHHSYYSKKRFLMAKEKLSTSHQIIPKSVKLVFKRVSSVDRNETDKVLIDVAKSIPPKTNSSYQESIEEEIFAQYLSNS